jgi:hypothetical protein
MFRVAQVWRPASVGLVVATALAALLGSTRVDSQGLVPPLPPGAGMQRPQARGTGLLLGQVVDGQSDTPVPGATVSISGGVTFTAPPGPPGSASPATYLEPRRVFADSQGRFTFTDLPAGSFMVSAMAPGYQSGMLGQSQPGGPMLPIMLAADQKLSGIKISIWRYASISGTVLDEAGAPAVNATVRVLRRRDSGPTQQFVPGQSARTDDRGSYRIANLVPGDYVVSIPSTTTTMPASAVDLSMQLSRENDGGAAARAFSDQLQTSGAPATSGLGIRVGEVFLQTGPLDASGLGPIAREDGTVLVQPALFFPAASTVASATTITLKSGDERTAINFQLNPVRGYSVSGALTGPDGTVANLGVRLMPLDFNDLLSDIGLETATTITDASGQFLFMGVPPGAYQLRVLRVPRPTPPPPPPPPAVGVTIPIASTRNLPTVDPAAPTFFARMPVSVGSSDITGLSVPLRVGPRLSGRVEFDGQTPKPALGGNGPGRGFMVNIVSSGGLGAGGMAYPAIVNEDGQFTSISVPPGRYLVVANAPAWTVKTAMVNGVDASVVPFELEEDVSGMVLTFFDRPAQLSGTVRNARGEPDAGTVVMLFRPNYQSCMEAAVRCVRTTPVSPSGAFTFSGLVPGDYLLVPVDRSALSGGATPPLTLIEALMPQAQRVTLSEGQRQTQDLTTRAGAR